MIKFYNTLTRKIEKFKPLRPKTVGIYSCGPTVYSNQHLGNMYAYVQWDVLVRFLRYLGYRVKWVMNITDVGHLTSDEDSGEDKMEKGARREELSVWQIADKYIRQFLESTALLNIKKPAVLCRATDHIKEQINLIKKIEANGFAYRTKTGLVFDTAKFPAYARFGRLNLKKQAAGKRVEIDPTKKRVWDFLLWITSRPEHIMQWDSPWGRGFPGWHIECTAMSTKYLGNQFDIHTGGMEHIPVHHTNEIAQAFAAFGRQTVNYWLHNGWLLFNRTKVSKSLGNIILVTDVVAKSFHPLSFRYLALTSHYRRGINFSWKGLAAAQNALDKLYQKTLELKTEKAEPSSLPRRWRRTEIAGQSIRQKNYQKKFIAAAGDDLNIPKALALTWKMLRDKNLFPAIKYRLLIDFDKVFGLNLTKIKSSPLPLKIKKLVEEREKLRREKNWAAADKLRQQIEKLGWQIEDTKKEPKLKTK